MSRHSTVHASRCSSSSSPRERNGTPSAAYSSSSQDTVGCTTSLPLLTRSSEPSSRASSSGCRNGAITALATSRIRSVTAAIADSSTSELGHGVAGSWLPGSAYSRGFGMTPFAPAEGPSTTCSLIMTESNPASSASRAHRTRAGRSRPGAMVQFSLKIRHIFGAPTLIPPFLLTPRTAAARHPAPPTPHPPPRHPATPPPRAARHPRTPSAFNAR